MAWIELHQSIFTHRKTLALADILELPEVYVAGHVIALWTWSLDNAPDGILPASKRIIARAAQWTDDPDTFVTALLEVGYLDCDGDTLFIHDWEDYAGRLIGQRRANAEKQKAWRDRQQQARNPHGNGDITVTLPLRNGATVPNPTVPNRTNTPLPPKGGERVEAFDKAWSMWPSRRGKKLQKQKALDQWKRIDAKLYDEVFTGIENFASSSQAMSDRAPDMFRWIRDRGWTEWQEPEEPDKPILPVSRNGVHPVTAKGTLSDPDIQAKYTTGKYAAMFNQPKDTS